MLKIKTDLDRYEQEFEKLRFKTELDRYEQVEQEALDIVKFFWLISESKYDKLRKLEGCQSLGNLDS